MYGELVLEMLVESEQARVVHLHCRTGYPDRGVALKLPGSHIVGTDASPAALQLARAKASTMANMVAEYRPFESVPTQLPPSAFSHALTIHPLANVDERRELLAELSRLLAPHGQSLIAFPMRGSFVEVADLLREYALKFDDAPMSQAVDRAVAAQPTAEEITAELEEVGFEFVDVVTRSGILGFQSGRDFFEDPVSRFLILPDIKLHYGLEDADKALAYVRDAIDKYWSEGTFELTVNIGCAAGRRVP